MSFDVRTQATLLLTVWLKKPVEGEPKPLTAGEWGRFAQWLNERDAAPETLLEAEDGSRLLRSLSDSTITPERVARLLARSAALGLALEKWERAGLWVMSRSDSDYPARLKRRLAHNAPPILFGCGNRALLDLSGVAVIGSREANDLDLAFTAKLANEIAAQGVSVVSGGARGVDEAAMLGALDKEGTVVGVLADSLLRAATSAKYRKGLMAKDLVLVSPFNPEAGFDVGNAMARNKYIYCMADAAVVVATGRNKGGTWSGAMENIRQAWVPLWVKPHPDAASGNAALAKNGARWFPEGMPDIRVLMKPANTLHRALSQPSLFDDVPSVDPATPQGDETEIFPRGATKVRESAPHMRENPLSVDTDGKGRDVAPKTPYDGFLAALEHETRQSPQTPEALQQRLEVGKTQMGDWLKRAVAEGRAAKFINPVRYQAVIFKQDTLGF